MHKNATHQAPQHKLAVVPRNAHGNLSVRQALCTSLRPKCAVTSDQRGALPPKGSDAVHRLVAAQSGGRACLEFALARQMNHSGEARLPCRYICGLRCSQLCI